jgi:hypothetical protein
MSVGFESSNGRQTGAVGGDPSAAWRKGFSIDQQPRQIWSLRSTATSSSLRRSRPSCEGTSRALGCRWPTGAPINRVSCVDDSGTVALVDRTAGPTLPTVCAIVGRPPSRATNRVTLIKFRMMKISKMSTPFPPLVMDRRRSCVEAAGISASTPSFVKDYPVGAARRADRWSGCFGTNPMDTTHARPASSALSVLAA